MAFTKQELEMELREFMVGFACSIQRMYGPNDAGALLGHPGVRPLDVDPANANLEDTHLWKAAMRMYEYGVCGLPISGFGAGETIDGADADVELFMEAIKASDPYLEEDDVRRPTLTARTVRTAIARHVLDGGQRYYTREDDEMSGYLSFAEVALLADMDERSVRNAANPKLADALATKNFGRRTMIHIDDARRWLTGRKGFLPTQGVVAQARSQTLEWSTINLPYETMVRVTDNAVRANKATWELVAELLDKYEGESR